MVNLDPEIKDLLENCRVELEKLNEEKEQAIVDFLEEQADEKYVRQKKIEKTFKKKLQEFEKEEPDEDQLREFKEANQKELDQALEEFKSSQQE